MFVIVMCYIQRYHGKIVLSGNTRACVCVRVCENSSLFSLLTLSLLTLYIIYVDSGENEHNLKLANAFFFFFFFLSVCYLSLVGWYALSNCFTWLIFMAKYANGGAPTIVVLLSCNGQRCIKLARSHWSLQLQICQLQETFDYKDKRHRLLHFSQK